MRGEKRKMGFGKSIGELLVQQIKFQKEKSCDKCRKQHTMQCPNSSKCYSTLDKPYFEKKVGD